MQKIRLTQLEEEISKAKQEKEQMLIAHQARIEVSEIVQSTNFIGTEVFLKRSNIFMLAFILNLAFKHSLLGKNLLTFFWKISKFNISDIESKLKKT